jgi:hypothetical protein
VLISAFGLPAILVLVAVVAAVGAIALGLLS